MDGALTHNDGRNVSCAHTKEETTVLLKVLHDMSMYENRRIKSSRTFDAEFHKFSWLLYMARFPFFC